MTMTKAQLYLIAETTRESYYGKPMPKSWPWREIVLTGFLVAALAVLLTLFVYVNP